MGSSVEAAVPPAEATVGFLWHGDRNIGGGERSTWLLARSLAPEFTPLLLYGRRNALVEQYERDGVMTVQMRWDPRLTGVYRDEIGLGPLSLPRLAWESARTVAEVARMIRRHRIDILHPADNLSKLVGGVAARLTGVKVVTHCRDELVHGRVERLLLRYQAMTMHRVIAVADRIGDLFNVNGCRPRHVVTIHNGIDATAFDPDRVAKARDVPWEEWAGRTILAIVATFDRLKGHRHLFEACAELRRREPTNWTCLVVGDGREASALRAQVAALGLESHVVFLGYRSDVASLMKGTDIVVIPSDQEAFPRVALEAMAMRLPVVASKVGGLVEAVDDGVTGVIVPPGDVPALTRALEALIADPARRAAMGARGRERVVERFTIERNVERTKQIYRELVARAR